MNSCQTCSIEHDGSYASGRFCVQACARAFSTSKNREQISYKISKGRICAICGQNFFRRDGGTNRHCANCKIVRQNLDSPWEKMNLRWKKNRLIFERGDSCEKCQISIWCGEKLTLQMDHINGNPDDNRKENLQLLCPNCHSLTPTWGGKNLGKFPNSKRSLRNKFYRPKKNFSDA